MRIFKNKWFDRFARQERISDETLIEAVTNAEKGLESVKSKFIRKRQGNYSPLQMINLTNYCNLVR
ncbi:MAG: type II toxin-antitoxin system RelE/ParE family toxin [Caldilineaceae bacterium]